MNLLFKLLFVSFLVIAVAVIFWLNIEQKRPPSSQIIEEDTLLKFSPIIENYQSHSSFQKAIRQKTSSAVSKTTNSSIYRWVDGNGQVHFSDQASHEDAVAYTPKQLGSINVSDDIKQRIAVDKYRVAKRTEALIVKASSSQATQAETRPAVANYIFSNTSAGQKHGYVLMSGRVSGGTACRQLRVVAYASSDEGRSVRGNDDIKMSGSGSRLFEMKVDSSWRGGGKRRPRWEISNITTHCLSQ